MAKAVKVKVKLESTAGTGTFFLAEKNPSRRYEIFPDLGIVTRRICQKKQSVGI